MSGLQATSTLPGWKQGDTGVVLTTELTADGQPQDLTGVQGVLVTLVHPTTGEAVVSLAPMQVVDALGGVVAYSRTDVDPDPVGRLDAEYFVTFADGTKKRFPTRGYDALEVEPNLDAGGSQAGPVASVVLSADTLVLVPGQVVPILAEPKDAGGAMVTAAVIAWSSSRAALVQVDAAGRLVHVTAVAQGVARISATANGITASCTVVVQPPAPATKAALASALTALGLALVTAKVRTAGETVSGGLLSAWADQDGSAGAAIAAAGAARPTVDPTGRAIFTTSNALMSSGTPLGSGAGYAAAFFGALPTYPSALRTLFGLGGSAPGGTLLAAYASAAGVISVGGGQGLATVPAPLGQASTFLCRRLVRAADTIVAGRAGGAIETVASSPSLGSAVAGDVLALNAQWDGSVQGDSQHDAFVLVSGAITPQLAPKMNAILLRYLQAAVGAPIDADEQLVVFGNSFAAGFGLQPAQSMTDTLMNRARFAGWKYTNRGITGQTTTQMVATLESDAYPRSQPERRRNVALVIEGTNEINVNGGNGTTAYTVLRDFCLAIQAAGFEVYAMTIPNRKDGGAVAGFDAARQTFNALIRTNFPGLGMGVADVGGDVVVGATNAPDDPTLFLNDKLHLNAAGALLARAIIAAAIL
jgi:lysophospholipase L1-like esterase